ncbi:MAG: hypothetical protein QOG23_2419 [Blastocatellia bacterium]|jgi:hypothetical protein|nr:hypothetical protein [Blastocatellia bacterium]
MPYCFSLAGFLQSISPFTATAGEESSLADIFSGLVTDYLSLYENLFDMKEMNLLMEWHEDVMITPTEELVPALDYVKNRVLLGHQYSVADLPRVALELKKFLSKSVEERQRALEHEANRQAEEIRIEPQARIVVERDLKRERELRKEDAADHVEQSRRAEDAASSKLWRERLAACLLISAAIWFFQDNLVASLVSRGVDAARWEHPLHIVTILLAASFLIVPAAFFVLSRPWRKESGAVVVSLTILVVIGASDLLTDETWSVWASKIEVAIFAGEIVYLLATRNRREQS